MSKHFWQVRNAADDPKVGEIMLYGPISSSSWWGDEVTPKQFKADLDALGLRRIEIACRWALKGCSLAQLARTRQRTSERDMRDRSVGSGRERLPEGRLEV
jgi:hypothetical protein